MLNQVEPYQDRAPVRIRTSERHIEYRCDSTIMLLGQLGLLSARGSSPELGLLRAYSAHVLSKQITIILPEHGTSRMPVSVVKVCCSLELSGKLSTKQNRCLTRLRASMQTCQNAWYPMLHRCDLVPVAGSEPAATFAQSWKLQQGPRQNSPRELTPPPPRMFFCCGLGHLETFLARIQFFSVLGRNLFFNVLVHITLQASMKIRHGFKCVLSKPGTRANNTSWAKIININKKYNPKAEAQNALDQEP